MKKSIAIVCALAGASASMAQPIQFDADTVGSPPTGWTCGVTGQGKPRWTVERDARAPSSPNVLMQTGSGAFPWCVRTGTSILDGFVEVKFKPMRGREDQAGGLVWRWQNGANYYVARANALENNVSLYRVNGGTRTTLKYADAKVDANAWHVLRVEFESTRFAILLDGKVQFTFDDNVIPRDGAVGVWTKADSVTAFDDFDFGVRQKR